MRRPRRACKTRTARPLSMNLDHFQDLQTNDELRRRLAAVIAQACFRNGKLENFHAGTYPSSEAGDYSDVKVVSARHMRQYRNISALSAPPTKGPTKSA